MADNLVFKNLKVRSFSLDFLEVLWEIEDTYLDPLDFTFHILRSESPMGPFDTVAGPFSDRYRFVDNRVNLLNRWRLLYYKIQSTSNTDPSNVTLSDAFTFQSEPDLIASEIQRLERLLWEEFAGRKCFIFPARTFGQRCGNCFDGISKGKGHTNQRTRSNCITCYDTGFARGYCDPIEVAMQIDPSTKSVQVLTDFERQQVDTTGRLPNFPLVKPRDLIVENENRRWRVVRVTPTERLRSVVHQEVFLHEVIKGEIEFQLPIRIGDLRNFAPSAERNFTNPQNLEAFESEAINHAFSIYGFPR